MNALLFLSFLSALAMLFFPISCGPRVYRLHGELPSTETYNVLLLADGYTSQDEEEAYKRAAEIVASDLFTDPALARWRRAINVYRIDTRSASPIGTEGCPFENPNQPAPCGFEELPAPPSTLAQEFPTVQNPYGPSVVDVDFGTRMCWSSTPDEPRRCRLMWMDAEGQSRALDLALDAVDIDVVVVVANTTAFSGGGLEDALVPTVLEGPGASVTGNERIGLAVIGVPPNAGDLLAHEFGHVLGLLDEYEGSVGEASGLYPDRNVWFPQNDAEWCWVPDFGTSVSLSSIPWHSQLDCVWNAPCNCSDVPSPGSCWQLWHPRNPAPSRHHCCGIWPSIGGPGDCTNEQLFPCSSQYSVYMSDLCSNSLGLWEGAAYSKDKWYRAKNVCKMRDVGAPFCEACKLVVDRTLAAYQALAENP
jgi:hypothetical protein